MRWRRATRMPACMPLALLGLLATTTDAAKQRIPISIIDRCLKEPPAPSPRDAAAMASAAEEVEKRRAASATADATSDSFIDVAFYDTRPRPDVISMRRAAALCNVSTAVRFHALLRYPMVLRDFRVTLLQLPPRAQCLYDGMRRISHGPGPQYLYKPLLHWVLPRDVKRLILLDTDVVMVRDVRELHAEFRAFGTAVLGVGNEQSNLYGKGGAGKNGGVQLLDLEGMRREPLYDAVLDRVASGTDGRRIGYLGDQTLYSYIAMDYPFLMHRLPCEWNRQISMHFGFRNETVHSCPRRCGILHANFGPFKCVAKLLQASPSCETWRSFQHQLAMPDPARMQLSAGKLCPASPMSTRATFKRAITRFFSDCCVPDALYGAGWPAHHHGHGHGGSGGAGGGRRRLLED